MEYYLAIKKPEIMPFEATWMQLEIIILTEKRETVEGGIEWEAGVSRCKLLYTKWMNSKVPLYSTANYIQYPMINNNGKDIKKRMCIYVYNWIACCTAEINTTL